MTDIEIFQQITSSAIYQKTKNFRNMAPILFMSTQFMSAKPLLSSPIFCI